MQTFIQQSMIKEAISFAKLCHQGQFRDSGEPFISHPFAVCSLIEGAAVQFGLPDFIKVGKVVALLHDVLEETDCTEEALRHHFPPAVVDAVVALTRKDEEGYGEYIQRVLKDPLAVLVKICDIEHNVSTIDSVKCSNSKKELRLEKYKYYYEILVDELLVKNL